MSDPVYCYPPDHIVLRNKFDIRDQAILDRVERRSATVRIRQGCPKGDFDLAHLRSIHRHLFQDVYDWAGELRTVEINKGGSQFQPRRFIETGMDDVHRRIVGAGYLKGTTPEAFAEKAGPIIGDLNYVHPFREGNGRTQLQYLSQLADQAGHKLDLRKIDRDAWMQASIHSHMGDHVRMTACIHGAIDNGRDLGGGSKETAKAIAEKFRRDKEAEKDRGR